MSNKWPPHGVFNSASPRVCGVLCLQEQFFPQSLGMSFSGWYYMELMDPPADLSPCTSSTCPALCPLPVPQLCGIALGYQSLRSTSTTAGWNVSPAPPGPLQVLQWPCLPPAHLPKSYDLTCLSRAFLNLFLDSSQSPTPERDLTQERGVDMFQGLSNAGTWREMETH
jgi:hypothetical protein